MRGHRAERGQGLLEFALVFPIMILLFMGMFDLARGIYSYNVVSSAAREGARYAITKPTDMSGIRGQALLNTAALDSSKITVNSPICVPSDCGNGSSLTLTVQYDFRPLSIFFARILLTGKSTMTVE